MNMLVHCIVGARPNFVKIGPIVHAAAASRRLCTHLIHTGQHYDAQMSRHFFEDLDLPEPDRYLDVRSGTHAVQTARIMESYEPVVAEERPDLVLVVGDVNSTMACALVAAKSGVPIAHVEAGLRSFDRTMPEEINRIVTDALADLLFTTCRDADENLRREGVAQEKIHFVGNVMIDTLLASLPLAAERRTAAGLGLDPGGYAAVTIHRPGNVDDAAGFERVVTILRDLASRLPVVFPMHPRTARRAQELGLAPALQDCPGLHLVEPMRYLEFVDLLRTARLVLTDSGGVQEETTVLGVPCLTLRPNTERPVTITAGTNQLAPLDAQAAIEAARRLLAGRVAPQPQRPPLWDGHAAERIVAVLEAHADRIGNLQGH
jgi:UDP-N-acetylglucosamine 2-epimerase (non-hydrolysing)